MTIKEVKEKIRANTISWLETAKLTVETRGRMRDILAAREEGRTRFNSQSKNREEEIIEDPYLFGLIECGRVAEMDQQGPFKPENKF